jgi:hypothetical protein
MPPCITDDEALERAMWNSALHRLWEISKIVVLEDDD